MTKAPPTPCPNALSKQAEFEITPNPPFDFTGTVHKPSHFPSSDESFDGERYWQTMRFKGEILGVRMQEDSDTRRPRVNVSVYATHRLGRYFIDALEAEIAYRFDLYADLDEFEAICSNDSLLMPAWERWKGMRVSAAVSLYEFLVIATVLQNAMVRRSVQMLDSLFRNIGSQVMFDGQVLSAFWNIAEINAVSEEYLRRLKLGYRAKTLKRQAEPFFDGSLDEYMLRQLPSPELSKKLLSLYGVGPASVGYLMFEVFKRYDALEYISPWEQKIYSRLLYEEELVPQEKILLDVDRRWGRWKMLALHYLFEDLFWQRRTASVPWLDKLIRL